MSDPAVYDATILGDVALETGEVLRDAYLAVRDGAIAAISSEPLLAKSRHEYRGHLLLPGFIDAHVHTRSNVGEGITATTTAAAAGGTTTVVDMPFDAPARPVRTRELLDMKIAAVDREAVVDVGLYGTFAPVGGLEAIEELAVGGVCGFKVSTIQVDPVRFPRIPDGQLLEALQEIARFALPVAAHQENQEIVEHGIAKLARAEPRGPILHARSRPPIAETEAAGRLLELARAAGAHLHMVHGTVARTFALIDWHRDTGTKATGETCIHYLTFAEDALERLGARAKCNPPLRSRDEVDNLWSLVADGVVDIVTSDHSPYPLASKETGDIFTATAGMPGVETLGVLLFSEGVAKGRITLARFLQLLCTGPARVFGFERKGRLQVGYDADVAVLNPTESHVIAERELHYRDGWSAFDGWSVVGKVKATFVRGRRVFADGEVIGSPGTGRFVRPGTRPEGG